MTPTADTTALNGATSQIDRRMAALSDFYVAPDERRLAELLSFAVEFGRLIVFYDLDNRPDGDWSLFFASDPTFALACISLADMGKAEQEFDALLGHTRAAHLLERKFEGLCQLFDVILRLVRMIDRWLSWPVVRDTAASTRLLQQRLVATIRDLSGPLKDLAAQAKGAADHRALGRAVPFDLSGLSPIWALDHTCPDATAYRGTTQGQRIDHLLGILSDIFATFTDAISALSHFAGSHLALSMRSADHAPQAALFIAFARLFTQAQAAIDNFSGRLTRFYYKDILRESVRAEEPDRLFLILTPNATPDLGIVSVPAHTLFPAGADSAGQPISYSSEKTLGVTAASVARVLTQQATAAPLFESVASPPVPSSQAAPAQVLSTQVAIPAKPAPVSWATFGNTETGSTDIETTEPATLGFAIASPTLLLTGGRRSIDITFSLGRASLDHVMPMLQQLADQTGVPAGQILCEILAGGFSLFLSTVGGWLGVDGYSVIAGQTIGPDPQVIFGIELPPAAAAVVGTAAVLPKDAKPPPGTPPGPASPDPGAPVMAAYLVQERIAVGSSGTPVEVYPYAILSGLCIAGLSVCATVTGLAGVALSNSTGAVDPAKPFLPFGSPPVLGAALVIQQPELFVKAVDQLTLNVAWYNLPQTNEGFWTYYRDYTLGPDGTVVPDLFNNRSFLVDIAVNQPGYWTLPDHAGSPPGLSHYLFRTDPGDPVPAAAAPLLPATEFTDLDPVAIEPPPYYDPAASSLLMVLSAPSYAFGDQLYARNVMAAVVADLPDPVRVQEICRAQCTEKHQALLDGGQVVDAAAQASAGAEDGAFHASLNSVIGATLGKLTDLAQGAIGDAIEAVEAAGNGGMALLLRQSLDSLLEQAGKETGGWFSRILSSFKTDAPATPQDLIPKLEQWIATNLDALSVGAPHHLDNGRMLLKTAGSIAETHAVAASAPVSAARMLTQVGLTTAKSTLTEPATASLEKCVAEQTAPISPAQYPNQPWHPQMASVTVDYRATTSLPTAIAADQSTRFYHLTPFGGYVAVPWPERGEIGLLPEMGATGTVLIGLSGVSLPQPLTLLIQMASGAGDWSDRSPPVTWQLLDGNTWVPLDPPTLLQSDGTNGLQNSGIVAFVLPSATEAMVGTVLPADYTWISASVTQSPNLFPRTAAIAANAVEAVWVGPGGADALGRTPLPAGTIKATTQPIPGISTVAQPLASFGGRPRLDGKALHPWLGERLRHKNRAIQSWDYVRLVLAEFPFVWQCEALPAQSSTGAGVAGSVLVVVVPGPSTPDVADPTAPIASPLQLGEVGGYLKTLASPFATIEVSNPIYVRITVTADVVFIEGGTPVRLNTDLVAYLSPWYYDAARAAEGGRYVNEDAIATFIRERPYVAAIMTISYAYSPAPSTLQWCYLTSAPKHRITAADTASPAATAAFLTARLP